MRNLQGNKLTDMYQDDDDNSNSFLMTRTEWNRLEDKLFEQALVMFPEELPDRWFKIASQLPGKSPTEVREHYDALVHDIYEIDSGRVELPSYADDFSDWDSTNQISLFLIGLKKFGKGDWRSISRNVVVTRTPTQVASHAQKYFLRHSSKKKERKRSSIHDITTVDTNSPTLPVDQNWIPPPGGSVQPTDQQQQTSALQQFLPPDQFPGDGDGSEEYPNYGYPPM
ncbi:hypothetical protein JRO89_XS14G0007700 [Xanthoceras sorbifolium]|uniref:Transcription factor DIVARICATA-like n=1 Tax=Xanthoceras sorbifolium TaxID=99658 RepID=A0ABQ8H342_9ROSI|nr:hypothetical protein JRO89_XS14G0007700 [Xanthoceras sorbifolium]